VKVQVMRAGTALPQSVTYVGPLEATSCKHWLTDPPASQANATEQVKIKTLRMGLTPSLTSHVTPLRGDELLELGSVRRHRREAASIALRYKRKQEIGGSYRQIAIALNERGIGTGRGGKWSAT
jgi:hypothetical protein